MANCQGHLPKLAGLLCDGRKVKANASNHQAIGLKRLRDIEAWLNAAFERLAKAAANRAPNEGPLPANSRATDIDGPQEQSPCVLGERTWEGFVAALDRSAGEPDPAVKAWYMRKPVGER